MRPDNEMTTPQVYWDSVLLSSALSRLAAAQRTRSFANRNIWQGSCLQLDLVQLATPRNQRLSSRMKKSDIAF